MDQPASEGESPQRPLGVLTLVDADGVGYSCMAYPARAALLLAGEVYAFTRLEGIWPQPVLIGVAPAEGVSAAEIPQRAEALEFGAVHLLVHAPDPDDPVPAADAAARLIAHYRPVLNLSPALAGAPPAAGSVLQQAAGEPEAPARLPSPPGCQTRRD